MKGKLQKLAYYLGIAILIVYPQRHIFRGVDLWDGGYNLANFQYSGPEYMDSMWFFATWISNLFGSFLQKLPGAATLVGMNAYTGLLVGGMAVIAFRFCVKELKIPLWLAFGGELMACSLCWLPTTVLYHYLTCFFLLMGSIFLCRGVKRARKEWLILAGIMLGINVGVRFSNLAQMGMIVVVWGYGWSDGKRLRQIAEESLWCVAGYLTAIGMLAGILAATYGLPEYLSGVSGLFAMTEEASDYQLIAMLFSLFQGLLRAKYWLNRIALYLVLTVLLNLTLPKKLRWFKRGLSGIGLIVLGIWLQRHAFLSLDYKTYQSVEYPCCVFLLGGAICAFVLFISSDEKKEPEILLSLTLLYIACVGSNNGIFSCINNLFLIAPMFLEWIRRVWLRKKQDVFLPIRVVLFLTALVVWIQSMAFGWEFRYERATGARNFKSTVEKIPVLRGMKTEPENARTLEELYTFLGDNGLTEEKYILFGQIPGVAYYLGLEPAMNIWSDLSSYQVEKMREALTSVEKKENTNPPIILTDLSWGEFLQGKREDPVLIGMPGTLEKSELLKNYMEKKQYKEVYRNDRYAVFCP